MSPQDLSGARSPSAGPAEGLSIVVIGRNAGRTLRDCLVAIRAFAETANAAVALEILYVDSASEDDSCAIAASVLAAAALPWRVLRVDSPRHSAALGRHVGMQQARLRDILFVDGDMVVDGAWLAQAMASRSHRVLTGQRCEATLTDRGVRVLAPRFYGDLDLGAGVRLGGLFLLRDAHLTPARFTPWLRAEEEADFLAQDPQLAADVFRTRETAYVHLNSANATLPARLWASLRRLPATASYVAGRLEALRRGHYRYLLRTSGFYERGAACSLLLIAGAAGGRPLAVAAAVLLAATSRRPAAVAYRSLVFPFELLAGLHHYAFNRPHYQVRHVVVTTDTTP